MKMNEKSMAAVSAAPFISTSSLGWASVYLSHCSFRARRGSYLPLQILIGTSLLRMIRHERVTNDAINSEPHQLRHRHERLTEWVVFTKADVARPKPAFLEWPRHLLEKHLKTKDIHIWCVIDMFSGSSSLLQDSLFLFFRVIGGRITDESPLIQWAHLPPEMRERKSAKARFVNRCL